jgi:hypothetical protein
MSYVTSVVCDVSQIDLSYSLHGHYHSEGSYVTSVIYDVSQDDLSYYSPEGRPYRCYVTCRNMT